jgi:hypothetical protein
MEVAPEGGPETGGRGGSGGAGGSGGSGGDDGGPPDVAEAGRDAPMSGEGPTEAGPGDDGPGEEVGSFVSCQTYCAALEPACPTNAEVQNGGCESLCELFFPTPVANDSGVPPVDQLACRLRYLMSPSASGWCTAGAFSGGGFCGLGNPGNNWCDVYCEFAATVCGEFGLNQAQCVQDCTTLNSFPPDAISGNNVACRIRQLVEAGGLAQDQRSGVCAAAAISPTSGPCM